MVQYLTWYTVLPHYSTHYPHYTMVPVLTYSTIQMVVVLVSTSTGIFYYGRIIRFGVATLHQRGSTRVRQRLVNVGTGTCSLRYEKRSSMNLQDIYWFVEHPFVEVTSFED